jgi:hypothetical protein
MDFYVADKESSSYYTLFFGIKQDNVSAIKLALADGADLSKVFVGSNWSSTNVFFNDNGKNVEALNLLDYALKENTAEVCALINQVLDPTNNTKQIFLLSFRDENEFNEKNLVEYLTQNKINDECTINNYNSIFAEHERTITTTLLHVACAKLNVLAVKSLIKNGANPNLRDSEGATVIELLDSLGARKAGKMEIAQFLVLNGLDMTNSKIWQDLTNVLQIPQLKKIIKLSNPAQSLLGPTFIQKKSYPLFCQWSKSVNSKQNYPLLNDIEVFEGRKTMIHPFLGFYDRDLNKFFKSKSLGEALVGRYKNKSPRLMKYINKYVFVRSTKQDQSKTCEINIEALYTLDFIGDLFASRNPSLFLEIVDKIVKKIRIKQANEKLCSRQMIQVISSVENYRKFLSLLMNNFSDKKIQELLEGFIFCSQKDRYNVELDDLIDMYSSHPKEYSALIKNTPFIKMNTLTKLHDLFAAHIEKLEQPLTELKQESFFPALNSLKKVSFMDRYSFKIAETNHELIEWGSQMSHCIGDSSYSSEAQKGKIILLALCVDSIPKYSIEISDGRIHQIQGKSHSKPPQKVIDAMSKVLKKEKVLQ